MEQLAFTMSLQCLREADNLDGLDVDAVRN
jgi:hypothetical protein